MEEDTIQNNNKKESEKKNPLTKWKKINIVCFIGSFILIQLASNIWNWLVNIDEYTLAFSMFLLFPIFVAMFCLALLQFGIVAAVFVFVSMRNIIKECKESKKIAYIVLSIEIILYVIYILNWFVI